MGPEQAVHANVRPTSGRKHTAEEERALIDRAQRGDRRAFDDIFYAYADDVYRWLTRLVGPVIEREDLVQEVFLAAYKGLSRFRGAASFSTWLYRIVVNLAYGHLRQRQRRGWAPWAGASLDHLVSQGISPEGRSVQLQQLSHALTLLDRLKPKKRIAFILREVEGLSLQEIGKIVGAHPAAVGQRVKHAHRELQQLIERPQRRRGTS